LISGETHLQEPPVGKPGRLFRQCVGWLISLACVLYIARQVNFDQLADAFTKFKWAFIPLALASLALGYSFRIERWALLLRAGGANVSVRACAAPFLASIAMNNVLPLRAGDFIRALVFPGALGIGRTVAAATLILERLVDLLTVLLLLAMGLWLLGAGELPPGTVASLTAGAASGGVLLAALILLCDPLAGLLLKLEMRLRGTRLARGVALGRDLLRAMTSMSRARILVAVFSISFVAWIAEAGVFLAVLAGSGMQTSPALALTVMGMATLATLVPSSPGYVGPFHLAAFFAIKVLGGNVEQATTFAILAHLSIWLPTTLAGGICLVASPRLFGSLGRP
jgi:glycosyltransferase 2 family protein